jgi:hypothetical protein
MKRIYSLLPASLVKRIRGVIEFDVSPPKQWSGARPAQGGHPSPLPTPLPLNPTFNSHTPQGGVTDTYLLPAKSGHNTWDIITQGTAKNYRTAPA